MIKSGYTSIMMLGADQQKLIWGGGETNAKIILFKLKQGLHDIS